MAAGKSTIGKQLAGKMDYSFIDLDNIIEKNESISIENIFREKGEDYFRKLESENLRNFSYPPNCVIATGGGLPCFYENMDWMNKEGITVYLKLKPEVICHRLIHSKSVRPLVEGKTSEELLIYIQEQLNIREQYYSKAKIIIEGTSLKVSDLENILKTFIKEQ